MPRKPNGEPGLIPMQESLTLSTFEAAMWMAAREMQQPLIEMWKDACSKVGGSWVISPQAYSGNRTTPSSGGGIADRAVAVLRGKLFLCAEPSLRFEVGLLNAGDPQPTEQLNEASVVVLLAQTPGVPQLAFRVPLSRVPAAVRKAVSRSVPTTEQPDIHRPLNGGDNEMLLAATLTIWVHYAVSEYQEPVGRYCKIIEISG
jgi:hypothetical protein